MSDIVQTEEEKKLIHEHISKITPDIFKDRHNDMIKEATQNAKIIFMRDNILTLLIKGEKPQATEMIVKFIESDNKIYTLKIDTSDPEIWIYSKEHGIFIPEGKSCIKQICRDILGEVHTSQLINMVVEKIVADTFISPADFFKEGSPDEIAVDNGILNIITRELTPFTPDKIIFNKLPVKYNPEQKCEVINYFIRDILGNTEDVKLIEELVGYTLYKRSIYQKAFIFNGFGSNGKSTLLEILKKIIGDNWISITPRHLESDQYAQGDLFKKMLNVAGDIDNKTLNNPAILKSIIGGDPITANRKYKNSISFSNYAKFVFSANEIPPVYDTTDGFFRKWIIVDFPFRYKSQTELDLMPEEERKKFKVANKQILDKLLVADELSGLLNVALDGLARLIKNGDFTYSKTVDDVRNLWIRKSDSFQAFCMDNIDEDFDSEITKQDLRKQYNNYCSKNKMRPVNENHIKKILMEKFGAYDTQQRIDEGNRDRLWKGIKFKQNNNQTNIEDEQKVLFKPTSPEEIGVLSQASQASHPFPKTIGNPNFLYVTKHPVTAVTAVTDLTINTNKNEQKIEDFNEQNIEEINMKEVKPQNKLDFIKENFKEPKHKRILIDYIIKSESCTLENAEITYQYLLKVGMIFEPQFEMVQLVIK